MATPGVLYDKKKPIERKGIEPTQVKSIKLLTDLDDGAANDGSGTIKEKSGILFDKEYEFIVESFTNDEPADMNLIKWAVSFTDSETGKYYENILKNPAFGKSITIDFTDTTTCGQTLIVKAYINNAEEEGQLPLFKHNRFRFFDREIIKNEVQNRMYTGKNIDQGESSMCAVALIGYFLAIENPVQYENIALNLHRKGEAIISNSNYLIKLDKDDHLIDVKNSDKKYPNDSNNKKMTFADFVFLFSIKDQLNTVFDYDPDGPSSGEFVEGLTGLTLPNEVEGMMKNILCYTDVKDKTNLVTSKWASAIESVNELTENLKLGYKIALLIKCDNFQKNTKSFFTVPDHWVGLNGISVNESNEEITVVVFTWGNISKVWTMSFESFEDGYFGFVAGK